jgi:hypothetical protein
VPKAHESEEVRILRFFEEEPMEKAEMLFNIVKEKMRTRSANSPNTRGATRKNRVVPTDGTEETANRV